MHSSPDNRVVLLVKMRQRRLRGLHDHRLVDRIVASMMAATDPVEAAALAGLERDARRLADRTRGARRLRGWL